MVNLHAVALYVEHAGGFALQGPYQDGFKCAALVLGVPRAACGELRCAWQDTMVAFGPDNFSTLQRCVKVCARTGGGGGGPRDWFADKEFACARFSRMRSRSRHSRPRCACSG